MKTRQSIGRLLPVSLLSLLAAACANTPETEFYTLSPLSSSPLPFPELSIAADTTIGIGPITLPEFLDRPQIVTRTSSNRLFVDEFHHWGGSLQEDFARVLTQNLALLLDSNRVRTYPSPEPIELDYRVFIDVRRFDGKPGEALILNAVWTVMDEYANEPLLVHDSHHSVPLRTADYEALTAAYSTALIALSLEIADALRTLAGTGTDN